MGHYAQKVQKSWNSLNFVEFQRFRWFASNFKLKPAQERCEPLQCWYSSVLTHCGAVNSNPNHNSFLKKYEILINFEIDNTPEHKQKYKKLYKY